jgi:adenine-specific DNA methylase
VRRAADLIDFSRVPDDKINPIRPHKNTRGLSAVTSIGISQFRHLYNPRQLLVIQTFFDIVKSIQVDVQEEGLRLATASVLHCAASRFIFQNSSLSRYNNDRGSIEGAFGKQALQNTWDFAECNPLSSGPASWEGAIDWVTKLIESNTVLSQSGSVQLAPAQEQVLPDDSADCLLTDPPYFAAIPYADLSDVFFVWERDFYKKY